MKALRPLSRRGLGPPMKSGLRNAAQYASPTVLVNHLHTTRTVNACLWRGSDSSGNAGTKQLSAATTGDQCELLEDRYKRCKLLCERPPVHVCDDEHAKDDSRVDEGKELRALPAHVQPWGACHLYEHPQRPSKDGNASSSQEGTNDTPRIALSVVLEYFRQLVLQFNFKLFSCSKDELWRTKVRFLESQEAVCAQNTLLK
jgi:hypothetical protein